MYYEEDVEPEQSKAGAAEELEWGPEIDVEALMAQDEKKNHTRQSRLLKIRRRKKARRARRGQREEINMVLRDKKCKKYCLTRKKHFVLILKNKFLKWE